MKKYRNTRFLGFALWAFGLLIFLPKSLLEQDHQQVDFYHFLLFNALVVCLVGGFLLVDSSNVALKRLEEQEPLEHTAPWGTRSAGYVRTSTPTLRHRYLRCSRMTCRMICPRRVRWCRSYIGLLAICGLLALVIHARESNEPATTSAVQPGT